MNFLKVINIIFPIFNLLHVNVLLIIMEKNNLGKFDVRSDKGIFVGYSMHNKAYKVYNKLKMNIEESVHAIFYEFNDGKLSDSLVQDVNLSKHRADEEWEPRKASTSNANSQEQPLTLNQQEDLPPTR